MPPERKIEKLLRAYAKKRKTAGDADFTLSAAARRRLQAEVAKRAQEEDALEDSSVSIWDFFRRQWAFLTVFTIAVFLGAALVLPVLTLTKGKSRGESALALKQELAPVTVADKLSTPAPATPLPAKIDQTDLPQRSLSQLGPANINGLPALNAPSGNAANSTDNIALALPTAAPMSYLADSKTSLTTTNLLAGESFGFGGGGAAGTFAAASSSRELKKSDALDSAADLEKSAPILAAGGAVLYQTTKDGSVAANAYRNTASASASPVLSRFKVTQRGSDIQIVDEDGSVYNGSWQVQAAQTEANSRLPNAPAQTVYQNNASLAGLLPSQSQNVAGNVGAAQTYSLRVSGDNRTLKQKVVFNGNLSVVFLANAAANNGQTATENSQNVHGTANYFGQSETRRDLGSNNLSAPAAYAISYIIGQATIAGTNQVQVNAVSVAP